MQDGYASQPVQVSEEEVGLLDMLVVLVQNAKLLVLGPLLASVVVFGGAYFWPKTFESTSILAVEKAGMDNSVTAVYVSSLMTSASILDPIAHDLRLTEHRTVEEARRLLLTRVKPSVGRQDKLLTLVTEGSSPERARELNEAILSAIYAQTLPRGNDLIRMQKRLTVERQLLNDSNALLATLARQISRGGEKGENVARSYSELLKGQSERQALVQSLEARLEGLSSADLVQAPTTPERAARPKKVLVAIMAALAVGIGLCIWVFVRQAWRNAEADPVTAQKLAIVRGSFGRKARVSV